MNIFIADTNTHDICLSVKSTNQVPQSAKGTDATLLQMLNYPPSLAPRSQTDTHIATNLQRMFQKTLWEEASLCVDTSVMTTQS